MHSAAFVSAFDACFGPWRRRRLHTVLLPLPQPPPGAGLPLVLVANHTSWWDGFLLRDLQRALRPGASFHVVMREDELRRRPLFRLLGALPLRPGSVASLRALLRTVRGIAREDPDAVIAWFPQGSIWPSSRRPLGFRRGIELLLQAAAPCTVIPVGLHVEALNRAAPTAFIAPGPGVAVPDQPVGTALLEERVARRLDAVRRALDEHGEAAVRHAGQLA